MATHILEEMLSHSVAVTQRGWNVRCNNVDQPSAGTSVTTISPRRRCEERMDYRHLCLYEVLEVIEEKSVVIGQGEAFAVNRSTGGDAPPHSHGSLREAVDRSAHLPIRVGPDRECF